MTTDEGSERKVAQITSGSSTLVVVLFLFLCMLVLLVQNAEDAFFDSDEEDGAHARKLGNDIPLPATSGAEMLEVLEMCRFLETADPKNEEVRSLAQRAWTDGVTTAERIGGSALRARVEDAAFHVLYPEEEAQLGALLDSGQPGWVREAQSEMQRALDLHEVAWLEVHYRTKRPASIYRKMQARQVPLEAMNDIRAFRILVGNPSDAYQVLDALEASTSWSVRMVKDYIANPKPNGYRSLHAILHSTEQSFEVQIRTERMHEWAEQDHWKYKHTTGAFSDGIRATV